VRNVSYTLNKVQLTRYGRLQAASNLYNLDILYRDDWLVAVDKPTGLLVHRTELARAETFALQLVRNQLRRRVYAIHRLDRPTSGVLLFGLTPEAAVSMSRQFERRQVTKRYLAVVRGWPEREGVIDYPLADRPDRPPRSALTRYRLLAQAELPFAVGRYPTSRYSLAEAAPETGRFHQIRRHFHHIFHPLIGDTTHGEGRHNRFFRETLGVGRLLLHARSLAFSHPVTGIDLRIEAPLDVQWGGLLEELGWGQAIRQETTVDRFAVQITD
jgi:tRNA pseudouridine65 synthase